MRKLIILISLFVPLILFAQIPHAGYPIQEADSSGQTYWEIIGTDSDTSDWKLSYGTMTLYYGAAKWNPTSDTPDIDLIFQTTNTSKDIVVTELTKTVSDSGNWKITETAIGSGQYYRHIATGGAANDSSKYYPFFDGYSR